MYFNVNITGSSYHVSTGIISVEPYEGIAPYLITYRNFDGTPFVGTLVDDGLYLGFPEYTKAINVPVGFYYIDVTDQYGAGETKTECVVVLYSGYTQQSIYHTPSDIINFPCSNDSPSIQCEPGCLIPTFYWLATEDGCFLNLAYNDCDSGCFLITSDCNIDDGCCIWLETETFNVANECGWGILLEDGTAP